MSHYFYAIGTGIIAVTAAVISGWLLYLWDSRQTQDAERPWWKTWRRVGVVVGLSYCYGLLAQVAFDWLVAVVPLAGFSILLSLAYRMFQFGFWPYQLEQAALWTAWASGWITLQGPEWRYVFGGALIWLLICSVLGGLSLDWDDSSGLRVRRPWCSSLSVSQNDSI